ncbi:homeobox-leucine zipper protein HOX19-like [Typha latifolia]|uniref:homeobox-leucine zipper protein HOX19-like n=1 Tax=Typha latifolia TaxID=4733 RepID=UPI003C2DA9E9
MDMASPQDVCDRGLDLGLAIGGGRGRLSSADLIRLPKEPPFSSVMISINNNEEPSLSLCLPDNMKVMRELEVKPHTRLSSPHSTVSSFSAAYPQSVKREKDTGNDEAEVEKVSSRSTSEGEEDGGARKKLRLTKEQSALLEDRFKEHSTLNPKQKQALAKQLHLRPRQVEVWFQNRRARTKLKQTEVDCEFLKRCCETLTDENRRLQKELQELKALKFAPQPPFYMQFPAAAAALTICPSCERINGTNDAAKASGGGPFVVAPPKTTHFFNPFTHSAAC